MQTNQGPDLDAIRGQLVDEQARLKQLLGAVTGSLVLERSDDDVASHKLRQRLEQVRQALSLMDKGQYGTCVGCGKAISAHRLVEAPTQLYCMTCELMGGHR